MAYRKLKGIEPDEDESQWKPHIKRFGIGLVEWIFIAVIFNILEIL